MGAERDGTSEFTVIIWEWERLGGIDEAGREGIAEEMESWRSMDDIATAMGIIA
jgi:hypothetical protein